ncbi:hypothetical protein [Streptomyces sp. NPDC058457]|uniref:hypothetical protein n=1 Tax=Streptomyces sp. NPDC058457 TaxID=3346507 RepID=UPI00365FB925
MLFDVRNAALFVSLVPAERHVEGNSLLNGSRAMSCMAGTSAAGVLVQLAGVHGRPCGKSTWGPPAHAALRCLTRRPTSDHAPRREGRQPVNRPSGRSTYASRTAGRADDPDRTTESDSRR